jgi:hypothetical protein
VRLVKGLYDRSLTAENVCQLFRFIDWLMDLPKPLTQLLVQEITQYQEEKQMPFMTSFEWVARHESLLEGIEVALKLKFGAEGLRLLPELREIEDVDVLRTVLQAIETAATPDDLRRVWEP